MPELGKYEIIEEIGRGGFATVFKARDTELDRLVALKVLHPYWSEDQSFVARFRQEARAAARLRHPNIVTVHDAGEVNGQLFIAMEYLSGRTLRELLQVEGALELERALPILEQLARALDYAHGQGVVHRDVKPSNVMVEETAEGVQATLMDFGLVKALSESTALTSQGTLLGSPEYMAPEQADPSRTDEIGPATDRYALGVVAYQTLTGQTPFPGNTPATLNAHLNLSPPDPRSVCANLSAGVCQVLLKALSKSPRGRYSTAMAMVDALRRAGEKTSLPWAAGGSGLPWSVVWQGVLAIVLAVTLVVCGVWIVDYIVTRPTPTETTATSTPESTVTATATSTPSPTLAPSPGATRVWEPGGSVMVYVPAGTFWVGSSDDDPNADDDEKPRHEVYLDAFWIDRTEVTNAQYATFLEDQGNQVDDGATWLDEQDKHCLIESTGSAFQPKEGYEDHPVIEVTWYGARAYCEWAGKRLPTEAEWEKAARGTDERIYPWGEDIDCNRANYSSCVGHIVTVGSYPDGASPYGALDMAGNVWEWVADRYGESYYADSPDKNPLGPDSGDDRVVRGGSGDYSQGRARCSSRGWSDPAVSDNRFGFRCVSLAVVTPTPTPKVGTTRIREKDGAVMVYVPAEEFWMGSDDSDPDAYGDEKPQQQAYVGAFWIDRTEVTNAQYKKCVDAGVCSPPEESSSRTRDTYYGNPEFSDHPVTFVSWHQARQYAEWVGGRLPTEAEWEYAARGPNGYIYPWGSDPPNGSLLNYNDNIGDTTPVGSYPDGASWCGALDMAGNVWEWTQSIYKEYPYDPKDGREDLDAEGYRVVRGGSWYYFRFGARCACRVWLSPDIRYVYVGFRVVVSPISP